MTTKEKLICLVLFIFQLMQAQSSKSEEIRFLDFTPIIDGKLDDKLISLQKKEFNHFFQFDNPAVTPTKVNYLLGYTATHLYLYIEAKADSITYRDRGFINGDGFKLLLAKRQNDSLTDEYYDIAFSPSKDKKYWARKRIWDYNRNQNHGKKLSRETRYEEISENSKCGFEVLLAWKDVYPYHPWFSNPLGYNLYFAKAIPNNAANGYSVVKDEGIWDEEIPKRNFMPIAFEKPKKVNQSIITAQLTKRNIQADEPLQLNLITIAKTALNKTIDVTIQNDSSKIFLDKKIKVSLKNKPQHKLASFDSHNLKSGHYNFLIRSASDTIAQYDFVIFPKFNFDSIRSQITGNPYHLQQGTVNTLLFKTNEVQQHFNNLKSYENGKNVLKEYLQFETELNSFLKGSDPYKGIVKPYRRAFQSKYDATFQPYTIKLPQDYNPEKKYPLLVFLHGSGQDEQTVLNKARSNGNFIEIAPFARDRYNCYDSESSQNDIIEAIEDVLLHFSGDKNKIVIAGFSMGGYGALRTFYQHPELYKGVAVFAGHPDLANEWLGAGHPNFLEDQFLVSFSKTPVFVYHGKKDGALPVSVAEELIQKLKSNGIPVIGRIIEDKTHEYPDAETNKIYFEWLTKITEK
jgi:predicted esterase